MFTSLLQFCITCETYVLAFLGQSCIQKTWHFLLLEEAHPLLSLPMMPKPAMINQTLHFPVQLWMIVLRDTSISSVVPIASLYSLCVCSSKSKLMKVGGIQKDGRVMFTGKELRKGDFHLSGQVDCWGWQYLMEDPCKCQAGKQCFLTAIRDLTERCLWKVKWRSTAANTFSAFCGVEMWQVRQSRNWMLWYNISKIFLEMESKEGNC